MNTSSWYLKKSDGAVYGPVRLSDLKLWVRDSRVAPDDQLSSDQQEWMPAPDLAALAMNFLIRYRNGVEYGPVHIRALCELIIDGDVPLDEPVLDKTSNKTLPACVVALRGLMAEEPASAPVATPTRANGEEAERLRVEHQAALEAINVKWRAAEEEKESLASEVKRLGEIREDMERRIQELSGDVERLGKERGDGEASRKEDLNQLQQRLDDVEKEKQEARAAFDARESKWVADRASLMEEAREVGERVSELEERLSASEEAQRKAVAETEERFAARIESLQKRAEEETARREAAERNADERVQEAVESNAEELKQQLEGERERHRKREAQLQQRVAQFEGDLQGKLEEMVRVKREAESAKQSAMAGAMGQGGHAVVRSALSRAKTHLLAQGADRHVPRSPAQRAAMAGRTPVRPPVRPPKHRPASGGRK